MDSKPPTVTNAAVADDGEEFNVSWIHLLSPVGIVSFCMMWLMSRQSRLFLAGAPFLLIAVGGASFAFWLRRAPMDRVIVRFEKQIQQCIEEKQTDHALVLMNGLIHLRPNELRYRFNRAWLLLENGHTQTGLSTMLDITPLSGRGYAPARLWLVRQSLAAEPLLELSDNDRLEQMRRAVSENPANIESHRLLASLYLTQDQLRLAEIHLSEVVDSHPELALDLARIQQRIGRDEKVISRSYATATEYYSTQLKANPQDVLSRIGWAQCLLAENRLPEAEALLREGLQIAEDERLQQGLADLQARSAADSLAQSAANAPQAEALLIESLTRNPENGKALSLLFLLSDSGIVVDREKLAPVVAVYEARQQDQSTATLQNAIVLTGLLKATGQTQRAVDLLKPLVPKEPSLRLVLAQLSDSVGDTQTRTRLVDEVLQETRPQLAQSPDDLSILIGHANALNTGHHYAETRQVLDDYLKRAQATAREQSAGFRRVYGAACLGLDDQLQAEKAEGGRVPLLAMSLTVGHNVNVAIQRLAALSVSDDGEAAQAESVLNQLANHGQLSALVFRQMGDSAMNAGRAARAVRYYDRARTLQPGDATILNNLAFALISQSAENAPRALDYVNEALSAVPYHPDILVTRAEIYIAMKRWQNARTDLDAALESRRTSPDVHRLLARTYTELNDPTRAAEHQRILDELSKK
ncbi:MAG: tetratricopeptide repeat protein [Planctomycetaceae bacterium]